MGRRSKQVFVGGTEKRELLRAFNKLVGKTDKGDYQQLFSKKYRTNLLQIFEQGLADLLSGDTIRHFVLTFDRLFAEVGSDAADLAAGLEVAWRLGPYLSKQSAEFQQLCLFLQQAKETLSTASPALWTQLRQKFPSMEATYSNLSLSESFLRATSKLNFSPSASRSDLERALTLLKGMAKAPLSFGELKECLTFSNRLAHCLMEDCEDQKARAAYALKDTFAQRLLDQYPEDVSVVREKENPSNLVLFFKKLQIRSVHVPHNRFWPYLAEQHVPDPQYAS